jgi:anti-sigma regulatory factor (Ser/Thr protein kinase)
MPDRSDLRPGHTWRLDQDERPAALARRIATEALTTWRLPYDPDVVRLVVAELVSNAEAHGKPPITLTLTAHPQALAIEVADASRELPTDRRPGHDGGFGLGLVRALAAFTVELNPRGKVVSAFIEG